MNNPAVIGYKPQSNFSSAKKYFEDHLAIGEYYSEGQTAADEWMGEGARLFSLNGKVKSDQFLALCDNLNPNDCGKLTGRTKSNCKAVRKEGSVSIRTDRGVFYDFTQAGGPPKS